MSYNENLKKEIYENFLSKGFSLSPTWPFKQNPHQRIWEFFCFWFYLCVKNTVLCTKVQSTYILIPNSSLFAFSLSILKTGGQHKQRNYKHQNITILWSGSNYLKDKHANLIQRSLTYPLP